MSATTTVFEDKRGATVVLPKNWMMNFDVRVGDELKVSTLRDGEISFSTLNKKKKKNSLRELLETIDSLPEIPWTRGDSPADDRELLVERYE